jgi:outer membrane protein
MIKYTLACILAMLGGLSLGQQDTLFLTLEEAREYALSHNKQLINARKDMAITEAEYKETRAQGLPRVQGNMDYMTNFNYEIAFEFAGGDAREPDIDYSLLEPGDIEVLKALGQMMAPSEPSTIIMEDQMNAQMRITQLLFSGQFWVGLELAEIAKGLSKKKMEITQIDIKEKVYNNYYLILVTEESLKILQQNLSNLNKTFRHTQNMYQSGLVEKSEVDQISMNVSQLQNTLESTRRSVQLSYNMLRIQLGLDHGRAIGLKENLASILGETEDNLLNREFDLEQNLSYQLMDIQEEMQTEMVDLEKWSYAPTLSGYYSYTEKILTTAFDLSPKNAAGFTLSMPIYSGGLRKARLDKTKIELDKARRSKSLLKDQLNLQENQLKYELRSAMDNYRTQKENASIAQSVYNHYLNKYQQGMVSSLDLTQANSNYLQAENNYLSSVLKLLQANLALEKLYNTL